jgi:pyridoxal-phosphate dependent enzyme
MARFGARVRGDATGARGIQGGGPVGRSEPPRVAPGMRPYRLGTMPGATMYTDITETIGDTRLTRLNRLGAGLPARIAVKHEGLNPFNSVKDRIGAAMIRDARSARG